MDGEDLSAMSVKQLRAHIASSGLSATDCFEKSELLARAREASTALVAKAPKGGPELVVALLNHASKALNVDMAPFLEAHVDTFDQSARQLTDGHGETFEQYDVFTKFKAQLEKHFDAFVGRHGFASAGECFAAIDAAVAEDAAEREQQMAQIEAQLKSMQQQWMAAMQQQAQASEALPEYKDPVPDMLPVTMAEAAQPEPEGDTPPADETDVQREQREIREAMERRKYAREEAARRAHARPTTAASPSDGSVSQAQLPDVPLMLFSQPVGLQQLLQHALSLTDYSTFSTIMRAKAQEVAKRRAWERNAVQRRQRALAIQTSLEGTPTLQQLTVAWADLRARCVELVMPGEGEEEGTELPADVVAMIHKDEQAFAVLAALDTPPDTPEKKKELFEVLSGPFLRILTAMPMNWNIINEQLPKLHDLISQGDKPCSMLCTQAVRKCHKLLDGAENTMDEATAQGTEAALGAKTAFAAAQDSRAARVQALEGEQPAPASDSLIEAMHWDGGAQIEQELGTRSRDPTALVPLAQETKRQLGELQHRLQSLAAASQPGGSAELTPEEQERQRTLAENREVLTLKAAWLDQRLRESMAPRS